MRPLMIFFCAAVLGVVSTAGAQEPAVPPAHISFVEGVATIEHDGESQPAMLNMPVVDGDRLRTSNGRVDVMFPDGSAISIDQNSEVEFIAGTRVRVLAGTIEHRAAQVDPRSPSAQNLPADLQPYAPDLDRSGAWQYDPSYGSVWYPTVAADWRPYYYGYWAPVPAYGPMWIGYDRWSWPTHHYGRWGYARSRWFWIPGRTWSAAWVSWGTAPDYVSWCPLGFDNRPLVALSVGYRSGWNPWTIVPRDRFLVRGGLSVHRYAVDPYRVAANTPFVVHRRAPSYDSRARVSASNREAVAVPRYQERAPSSTTYRSPYDYPRRTDGYAPSTSERQVPIVPQAVPRYSPRGAAAEQVPIQRAPSTGYRVPNTIPEAPRAVPRQSAPVARESAPVVSAPVVREGAPVRHAPPAREPAPAYQAPAPQRAAPQPAPNAGPRGESSRGQERSEGTAVRRPR